MADVKISALTAADAAAGADELAINEGGTSKKLTVAQIKDFIAPSTFNVKAYGAVGDGSADDTSAINSAIAALNSATRGVLYFPAGTYKVTTALTTISVSCMVTGDGPGMHNGGPLISAINCTSQTAVLFTVSSASPQKVHFRDLGLYNTYGGTASAGSAIYVTSSDQSMSVSYERVLVSKFYDGIDVAVGAAWSMRHCFIWAFVRYGVRVRNTVTADAGDWSITDTLFYPAVYNSTASLRIESSGGGKIANCKFNAALGQKATYGIDLAVGNSVQTGQLQVINCSFENYATDGIHGTTGTAPSVWYSIQINNCQFADNQVGATGRGINLVATTAGDFYDITIVACTFKTSGAARAAIALTNVNDCVIAGSAITTYNAFVTTTTCVNVRDNSGGVAGGYSITRGATALDGSNPTPVATGLTTVVSFVATLAGTGAPGTGTSHITYSISGGTVNVYAWKPTSTSNPSLVASTGTETFSWIAVGS